MWAGATLLGCDGSASEMDAGELRDGGSDAGMVIQPCERDRTARTTCSVTARSGAGPAIRLRTLGLREAVAAM